MRLRQLPPQPAQSAMNQTCNRGNAATQLGADFGQRQLLPVITDDGDALRLRQLINGIGNSQQLFRLLHRLAGRGPVRSQPLLNPARRLVEQPIESLLAGNISLGATCVAQCVKNCPHQYLPQPCHVLPGIGPTERLTRIVCPEQRFLDDIGRINPAAQPPVQLDIRQEPEVVAKTFEIRVLTRCLT